MEEEEISNGNLRHLKSTEDRDPPTTKRRDTGDNTKIGETKKGRKRKEQSTHATLTPQQTPLGR